MRQIGVKNVKLSEYEMSIAAHLVDPLSIQVILLLSNFISPHRRLKSFTDKNVETQGMTLNETNIKLMLK